MVVIWNSRRYIKGYEIKVKKGKYKNERN